MVGEGTAPLGVACLSPSRGRRRSRPIMTFGTRRGGRGNVGFPKRVLFAWSPPRFWENGECSWVFMGSFPRYFFSLIGTVGVLEVSSLR